jgi:Nup133 N terminal like
MNGSYNNVGTPFGGSSSLTVPSNHSTTMMTPSRPTDEYWRDDFRPLQDAGKHILGVLRKDESNPQGDLYRRIISKVGSGADPEINPDHHYFYPGIANKPSDGISSTNNNGSASTNNWTFTTDSKESPIRHVGTVPLPPELQDRRKKVKISTMMGLYPQGELSWLTVDQTVFLWSYNSALDGTPDGASRAGESTQVMEFEMPSKQPIVSVGLAPPKPGKWLEICSRTTFRDIYLF